MGQNETKKLNRNQAKALNALLEYPTVTQAAEACGLARQTIYRYLEEDHFKRALNKAIQTLTNSAGATLAAGQKSALKELYQIMTKGRQETNRRLAAVAWLDLHLKYSEGDILERVTALEEAVFNEQKET